MILVSTLTSLVPPSLKKRPVSITRRKLHLERRGHVADFIEEQRSLISHFKEAEFPGLGAGKRRVVKKLKRDILPYLLMV